MPTTGYHRALAFGCATHPPEVAVYLEGPPVSSSSSLRSRARRSESGASAVEFALIVPLVVMLLFGTVSAGLAYSDHVAITNAAREGSRYGAAADAASSTWATSVQTRVQQVYFNAAGAAPTDNQVCVKLVQADGTVRAVGHRLGVRDRAVAADHVDRAAAPCSCG